MDNTEFILSKLDSAIVSAKNIDLGSSIISAILGLASIFLALAAILPPSVLGLFRFLLLFATGVTVLLLYLSVRNLSKNRKARLRILRKWHQEIFFEKTQVNESDQAKMKRLVELIHLMEDNSIARNPHYEQLDSEFMNLLKTAQ